MSERDEVREALAFYERESYLTPEMCAVVVDALSRPAPVAVTEAMVEAAARLMYPVEDQSLTRQLKRRELLRNALTAALAARGEA